MNKLVPTLIIIGALFFAFNKNPIDIYNPIDAVSVDNVVSEKMKSVVSEIVSVVKDSKASKDKKNQASALWLGAGDVWATLDVNTTSDKIEKFNENLFLIYSKRYDLSNEFPGFAKAADKCFSEIIGEYPKQMTKEDCQKMSDLCYAIAWAFEQ